MIENMYRWKKFREVFVFKGLYDFIKSVTVIDLFLLFNSYRNRILIKLDILIIVPLYLIMTYLRLTDHY